MGEPALQDGQSPGSSMAESHRRLKAEGWTQRAEIKAAVVDAHGKLQSITGGAGYILYDEYSIVVEQMPAGITPEAFVLELARNLNKTVYDGMFDGVNVFKRRRVGAPIAGEIVDIDIAGPDNGSVILAEITSTYFIYECITTSWGGSHPEYGSREFGFQRLEGGAILIYTRGCSSPANRVVGFVGAAPQNVGWTRLMRGISDTIAKRGGKPRAGSFVCRKWTTQK
ncbi:MAG TPA: hypothetical protein VFG69_14360 [Nannocystaceae bacterium]|nr:hypothetical protein [Nannocystaceae bacterium]